MLRGPEHERSMKEARKDIEFDNEDHQNNKFECVVLRPYLPVA
jgi:hypothetical protein